VTTLIEFLEERLREDQEAAEAAAPGPWHMDENQRIYAENGSYVTSPWTSDERDDDLDHVVRHHPARVLREVTAKRAILAAYTPKDPEGPHPGLPCTNSIKADPDGTDYDPWDSCERHVQAMETRRGQPVVSEHILRDLAAIYSDHEDFREEWAA